MRSFLLMACFAACGIAAEPTQSETQPVHLDPRRVDRSIRKEPKYVGKAEYCQLVFGPEGKDRVWLVRDGEHLYVDKNGNGDITEPGEKVEKAKVKKEDEHLESMLFTVDEIRLGKMVHKSLTVETVPVTKMSNTKVTCHANFQRALEQDKNRLLYTLTCEVEVPGLQGGGSGGRVVMCVAFADIHGAFFFSQQREEAPVVHLGGPLEMNFDGELPKLRAGRASEFQLVVGTPGIGLGSYAYVVYENCIPKDAYPKVEIQYQPKQAGQPVIKELYEIKERC